MVTLRGDSEGAARAAPSPAAASRAPGAALEAPSAPPPLWLRVHRVTGAVPLAGFLVLHLATQLSALGGPARYQRWATLPASPVWLALELALVYVPLALHVGLGAWRVLHPDAAPGERAGVPVEGRPLLRASGVILLVFLLVHVAELRLRLYTGELAASDYYDDLCARLSSTRWGGVPLTACGYLLGIAAAAHHAAQGLYQAALGLGLVGASRASRLRRACVAFGLCCFGLGALIVIDLATGSVLIHLPGS